MKIKILLLGLMLLFGYESQSQNFEPYATAVWIGPNDSETIYNVSYSSPNGFETTNDHAITQDFGNDFQGKDFGAYDTNSRGLIWKGAEVKTFKEPGANTCTPKFNIRTFLTGETPPEYSNRDIPYFVGCDLGANEFSDEIGKGPCNTDGYQKWQGLSFLNDGNANKIDEFDFTNRKEGSYVIEFYVHVRGDNNGNGCDDDTYDNRGGNNYTATYTICPTYSNGSKLDPTKCGGADGKIILNYSGLFDGSDIYDGLFSHDGVPFPNGSVSVTNDVVTISGLAVGTYTNIMYTSGITGCNPIGDAAGFTLTTGQLIPNTPVVDSIIHPTCDTNTGSVNLSDLPALGEWTITETITGNTLTGNGTSATFSGLPADETYEFTVENSLNCTSVGVQATIDPAKNLPPLPDVTVDCDAGFGNAVITVVSPTGVGFLYSFGGGPFQVSNTYGDGVNETVNNGSYTVTVRNPDGCESTSTQDNDPDLFIKCGCPDDKAPIISLSSTSGLTCPTVPHTVSDNTFSGENVVVTSIVSNGAGQLDVSSANISPFSFTYTPDPSDRGSDVIVTLTTNNPSGDTCEPATSVYTLTVKNVLPPIVVEDQEFCKIDKNTVADIVVSGTNILWYTSLIGGTSLDPTDLLVTGSYYASQNDGECESYDRAKADVVVNDPSPIDIVNQTPFFCVVNNPTVADLEFPDGAVVLWYTVVEGGTALQTTEPLVTGNYFASQILDGCESSIRTIVAVTVNDTESLDVENQKFCAINNPTVADLETNSTNVKWYESETATVELSSNTLLIDGEDYFATQTPDGVNQCESSGRSRAVVEVEALGSITVQDKDQVFCRNVIAGKVPTVADLAGEPTVPGGVVNWYESDVVGDPALDSTVELIDGKTYYGSQTTSEGCEGTPRVDVNVTLECRVVAQDDLAENANGVDGVTNILNVINNDNSEGDPIDLAVFSLVLTNPNAPILPLIFDAATGNVSLSASTPAGEYTFDYTIFEGDEGDDVDAITNKDSATVTIRVNARPDLSISKTVSDPTDNGTCGSGYYVGEGVTFTIVVENIGIDEATVVQVLESLPSGYKFISADTNGKGTYDGTTWVIGTLDANTKATMIIQGEINAEGNYENTASVSALEIDPIGTNDSSSVTIEDNIIPVVDMSLKYDISNPNPTINEPVTLTLTAQNDGPSTATSVVVNHKLPVGYIFVSSNPSQGTYDSDTGIWSIGSMLNGASSTLTVQVIIKPKLEGETDDIYVTSADISAVECEKDGGDNSITLPPVGVIQIANLAITIEVDDMTPKVGGTVVFKVFVENAGDSFATGVEVETDLPTGYTFVGFNTSDSSGTYDPITNKWFIGDMNVLTLPSPTLEITATVNPGGIYTMIATVDGNEPDNDPTNNTDMVTPVPVAVTNIVAGKSVVVGGILEDKATVGVEDEITFTLSATNNGPSSSTGSVVRDLLPAAFTYVSHESGKTYDSISGDWQVGSLAVGETATLDIVVIANVAGTYTNKAELVLTNELIEVSNPPVEVPIDVQPSANLGVTITASSSVVNTNENVTYTIVVTNEGPSAAPDVVLDELIPMLGLTYFSHDVTMLNSNLSISDDDDKLFDVDTGVWNIGQLDSGSQAVMTFNGVVNGSAESITNSVAVESLTVFDSKPENNKASVTVVNNSFCVLFPYNFVSANGDGRNDYFKVDGIECFGYRKVEIFNRWGTLVYSAKDYEEFDTNNGKVFKGLSQGEGAISEDKELPSGTYFYIITFHNGFENVDITGYIQLTR